MERRIDFTDSVETNDDLRTLTQVRDWYHLKDVYETPLYQSQGLTSPIDGFLLSC